MKIRPELIHRLLAEIQQSDPVYAESFRQDYEEARKAAGKPAAPSAQPQATPAQPQPAKPQAAQPQPAQPQPPVSETPQPAAVTTKPVQPEVRPEQPVRPAEAETVSEPEVKPETKSGKKKEKQKLRLFTKLLIVVDLCAVLCFVTAYGPISAFRDWLVLTALNTATHKHFAYVLYSDAMVKKVQSQNTISEFDDETDTSAIHFVDYGDKETYDSIYEEQILKRDDPNQVYKIVTLDEDRYTGFITVIYDPTRLNLAMAETSRGEKITHFAKRLNAPIAANCGPAEWNSGYTAMHPYNSIICEGKVVNEGGTEQDYRYSKLIGMTYDGILKLKMETAAEGVADGYKWAVCFGPYLIVNGKPAEFKGNGGYGINPRQAIGQRQDGIVLIVTIDGRGGGGSAGISMPDLTEIFVRYGCYNAANLDGGGSTMLVENGILVNNPVSYNHTGERKVYNCMYITP